MPDSLLLLAFALTLVLNAALILVAIRAMRHGASDDRRDDAARDSIEAPAEPAVERQWAGVELPPVGGPGSYPTSPDWPPPSLPSVPVAPRQNPRPPSSSPPEPAVAPPAAADTVAPGSEPANGDADATAPQAEEPGPSVVPTRRRRRPKAQEPSASTSVAPAVPKSRSTGGRRRRFSLPPLDDDGDRVSRSIETFLSSGDPSATDDVPAPPDRDAGQPPTTVALVAVVEVPGHVQPDRDEPLAGASQARIEDALVAVERALRAAARGTDRVERVSTGAFRVVLASTGELAARAYLRRVRSMVEPLLDQLVPRRRLAVATATILSESLDQADKLAERRLESSLATHDEGDDEDLGESRAAPD